MSDKKADKPTEEIVGEPIEELETEELDEAHGGRFKPIGQNFNTASGRGDVFTTISGISDNLDTIYGGLGKLNDLPLKR